MSSEKQYCVSVAFQRWDEESRELGETDDKGWEFEDEIHELEELVGIGRRFNLSAASTRSPEPGQTWFYNETCNEDRSYFEDGVETEYHLFIQQVDGRLPTDQDLLDVANELGVTFESASLRQRGPRL